eukprot:evm.model.NODE_1774_length_14472_cov_27.124170.4
MPMATHATAAPAPSGTSKRGSKLTIAGGLTLLVMLVVALGAYIHLTRHDARSLFHGHGMPPAISTRATRTVSAQLRRHLAWGEGEDMEDVLEVGDVVEEDGEDMEGPGVPEDGTTATSTKKKKKKFSFDDELDGDEEPAAEEDEDDDEEDEDEDEEDEDDDEEPDMAEDGTTTAAKKKKKKRKFRVDDELDRDEKKGAPKKKKNKKKTVTKSKKGGTKTKSSRGGRSSRMSNAGSMNQRLDGTKDPMIPTLDTRDNRRFADEVVLPDGHTVSIDVPSP